MGSKLSSQRGRGEVRLKGDAVENPARDLSPCQFCVFLQGRTSKTAWGVGGGEAAGGWTDGVQPSSRAS